MVIKAETMGAVPAQGMIEGMRDMLARRPMNTWLSGLPTTADIWKAYHELAHGLAAIEGGFGWAIEKVSMKRKGKSLARVEFAVSPDEPTIGASLGTGTGGTDGDIGMLINKARVTGRNMWSVVSSAAKEGTRRVQKYPGDMQDRIAKGLMYFQEVSGSTFHRLIQQAKWEGEWLSMFRIPPAADRLKMVEKTHEYSDNKPIMEESIIDTEQPKPLTGTFDFRSDGIVYFVIKRYGQIVEEEQLGEFDTKKKTQKQNKTPLKQKMYEIFLRFNKKGVIFQFPRYFQPRIGVEVRSF